MSNEASTELLHAATEDTLPYLNLNFSPQTDPKSLHRLHSYPAKMLSSIAATFINSDLCPKGKNKYLLDPFVGSGTSALEAKRARVNVYAIDVSPLARLITETKVTNYNHKKLRELEANLNKKINKLLKQKRLQKHVKNIDVKNVDYWFQRNARKELAAIKLAISELKSSNKYKKFFKLCFSAIIRLSSNADREIAPVVISKKMRKKLDAGFVPNPIILFQKKIETNITALEKEEPNKNFDFRFVGNDARTIKLPDSSVDFVITSPPYINAQKYVRSTQLELQWLDFCVGDSVIELDKKIIGTEKVFAKDYLNLTLTNKDLIDKLIKKIYLKDKRRAYIVSKYFIDMQQCISEISRVMKSDSYFVLVVGNNVIRDVPIPLDKISIQQATSEGLTFVKSIRNKIKKRKLSIVRNKTAKAMDYERILIFRKSE